MNATLKQAGKLLGMADDQDLTDEQLQHVTGSGLITDIFKAARRGTLDVSKRAEIQKLLGLRILELIGKVKVSAVSRFVAGEHFRKDNTDGVEFWGFGNNFQKHFLDASHAEENVPQTELAVSKLTQSANDKELLEEGIKRVFLAYLSELLKRQPNGEKPNGKDKMLLVNGYANIFEVEGTEWAVNAYWNVDGWDMNAHHVSNLGGWDDGAQVFSRYSELQKS